MTKRLTEAIVSALQPDPRHTRDIPDGGARGLYVILHPSGSRTPSSAAQVPERVIVERAVHKQRNLNLTGQRRRTDLVQE
jgi:hypothetical protein